MRTKMIVAGLVLSGCNGLLHFEPGKPFPDAGHVDASDAGADVTEAEAAPVDAAPPFGGPCTTNADCGPALFCLHAFDVLTMPEGLCSHACAPAGMPGASCEDVTGACLTERMSMEHPSPASVCFPTCALDRPCRTGWRCQFVYMGDRLVEPSICAPAPGD